MKEIVITNPNGITLHTKKSLVNDDIKIKLDKEMFGIKPEGTLEITENGTYDVSSYAEANVNIESKNTLKNLLDARKSARYLFSHHKTDNLSELIQYNDTENVEDFYNMFKSCMNVEEMPLINTSKGIDFSSMYGDCRSKTFPLIDTSNGTIFESMYSDCTGATTLPTLVTKNGTTFRNMYGSCYSLTEIELDTIKATNLQQLCYYGTLLKKATLSHYNINSSSNGENMFYSCNNLKAVIIRSFGESYVIGSSAFRNCHHMFGTYDKYHNPNSDHDGYIYVPRNMIATLQSATNWSVLQFRALEDYTKDGTCWGEFDDEKAGITYD